MSGDVYGGWEPTTAGDLALCEADPYITQAGVVPAWVLELRAAVASPEVCTCGRFPIRRHCATCSTTDPGPDTPSPVAGPVAASTTGSSTSTPTENRETA